MSLPISWLPVLPQCATQATNPVYKGPTSHSRMNDPVMSPHRQPREMGVHMGLNHLHTMLLPYPVASFGRNRGLNRGPWDYRSGALLTELIRHLLIV